MAVTVPGIAESLSTSKAARSRVSGRGARMLAAEPVKKTSVAARLAAAGTGARHRCMVPPSPGWGTVSPMTAARRWSCAASSRRSRGVKCASASD